MVIDFQPSGCLENFNPGTERNKPYLFQAGYFIAEGMVIPLLIYNIDSANSLYMRTLRFLKGRRFRTIAY
jgi:hypothetical protein